MIWLTEGNTNVLGREGGGRINTLESDFKVESRINLLELEVVFAIGGVVGGINTKLEGASTDGILRPIVRHGIFLSNHSNIKQPWFVYGRSEATEANFTGRQGGIRTQESAVVGAPGWRIGAKQGIAGGYFGGIYAVDEGSDIAVCKSSGVCSVERAIRNVSGKREIGPGNCAAQIKSSIYGQHVVAEVVDGATKLVGG